MECSSGRPSPGEDLAAIGRIAAGATHDIRNVLATISEQAGLAGDLLAAAGREGPLDRDKLKRLADGIGAQIRRGQEIVSRLKRFAHGLDEPASRFDAAALLRDAAAFAERPLSRKGARLETRLPQGEVMLTSSPLLLHEAIHLGLELFLEAPGGDVPIVLSLDAGKPFIGVTLAGRLFDPEGSAAGNLARLRELAAAMGGALDWGPGEGGGQSVTLRLPS